MGIVLPLLANQGEEVEREQKSPMGSKQKKQREGGQLKKAAGFSFGGVWAHRCVPQPWEVATGLG